MSKFKTINATDQQICHGTADDFASSQDDGRRPSNGDASPFDQIQTAQRSTWNDAVNITSGWIRENMERNYGKTWLKSFPALMSVSPSTSLQAMMAFVAK